MGAADLMIPDSLSSSVGNYDYSVDVNSSGFQQSEIDSGGFFGGIIGIFTAVGRFLGFVFFGLFLPADTPDGFAILMAIVNTSVTMMFIAWFISAFWDG